MKQLLLAGATLLAVSLSERTAYAEPIVFDYTGSLVTFTVPTTGAYQILAFGAQGGDVASFGPPGNFVAGGGGAEIGGNFAVTAGETLQIPVGGAGMPGGGGGGSFVVGPGNTPLVIAGGGGGASIFARPGEGGLTPEW